MSIGRYGFSLIQSQKLFKCICWAMTALSKSQTHISLSISFAGRLGKRI
jgi:hypothetical protein